MEFRRVPEDDIFTVSISIKLNEHMEDFLFTVAKVVHIHFAERRDDGDPRISSASSIKPNEFLGRKEEVENVTELCKGIDRVTRSVLFRPIFNLCFGYKGLGLAEFAVVAQLLAELPERLPDRIMRKRIRAANVLPRVKPIGPNVIK